MVGITIIPAITIVFEKNGESSLLPCSSVEQWLVHQTHDPAVAGSILTTAHVVNAFGEQFTNFSFVHLSAK